MVKVGEKTLEVMQSAKWYNNWLNTKMKPFLGKNILEAGFGIGNFTEILAQNGKVTAFDKDRKYLHKKVSGKGISTGYGDLEKGVYFFDQRSYDSLVCLNVLEHIKNDRKALMNMKKLLKNGGHLILLVPAHKLLYSELDRELGHFRRYSKKEVYDLLSDSGLKPVVVAYVNWWAAIGWLVFLKLTGFRSMPRNNVKTFNLLAKIFLWPEKYINPPFGLSVFAVAKKQ